MLLTSKMNPYMLEADELKVECDLRNIRGLQSVQQSMLKFCLNNENSGEEVSPQSAHLAACKNPKREVALCAKKIIEIQESLKESLKSSSENNKPLIIEAMQTRALHYRSRLNRISKSEAVGQECPPVMKLCEELIKVLTDTSSEEDKLNKSISNLEKLDTQGIQEVVKNSGDYTELRERVANSISHIDTGFKSSFVNSIAGNSKNVMNIENNSVQSFGNNSVNYGNIQDQSPFTLQKLGELLSNVLQQNGSSRSNHVDSNTLLSSSPNIENSNNTTRLDNQPVVRENLSSYGHVHKWNLSFDGSKDGLNIERFLYRIETNASVYRIPEYILLSEIQYLLKGKALNWYWAHKEAHHPRSWQDFRRAMIKQFKNESNDFDIRQSIGERKQKLNETFQDFYSAISELSLALSEPLRDLDFMLILHGNMRSGLKEKLAGRSFTSSSELFDECVRIENIWRQISYIPEHNIQMNSSYAARNNPFNSFSNYRNNNNNIRQNFNSREVSEINSPMYTGYENQNEVMYMNSKNDLQDVSEITSQRQVNSQSYPKQLLDRVKCWNCGETGHFYFKCNLQPQHIFCQGCGQSDITFEYCFKCQGNMKREVKTGRPTSHSN